MLYVYFSYVFVFSMFLSYLNFSYKYTLITSLRDHVSELAKVYLFLFFTGKKDLTYGTIMPINFTRLTQLETPKRGASEGVGWGKTTLIFFLLTIFASGGRC